MVLVVRKTGRWLQNIKEVRHPALCIGRVFAVAENDLTEIFPFLVVFGDVTLYVRMVGIQVDEEVVLKRGFAFHADKRFTLGRNENVSLVCLLLSTCASSF